MGEKILFICSALDVTPYELLGGSDGIGSRSNPPEYILAIKDSEYEVHKCGFLNWGKECKANFSGIFRHCWRYNSHELYNREQPVRPVRTAVGRDQEAQMQTWWIMENIRKHLVDNFFLQLMLPVIILMDGDVVLITPLEDCEPAGSLIRESSSPFG